MTALPSAEIEPVLSSPAQTEQALTWLSVALPQALPVAESFCVVEVSGERWLDDDVDMLEFDRKVHAGEDRVRPFQARMRLKLSAPSIDHWCQAAAQLAVRYQRLFSRLNAASACQQFAQVLDRHAGIHDRSRPLVRADYDHSVDVWQWTLRMVPEASRAVQIAALFHDVERLRSEPDRRIEQHAPDYQAFKDKHAAAGSQMLREALWGLSLGADMERAAWLVAKHERPEGDAELALLNDADALSFFSLNSAGFLSYFGEEHTRMKVGYTLRRMGPMARARLGSLRLPAAIAGMVASM